MRKNCSISARERPDHAGAPGGMSRSFMGDIMKTDFRRVLFSAICLFSSVHITQAAEPYASIGVGFAAERVDASASGINHPTRCDRLLYSDPLTAPGDATCTDNTVRHISNGSFKLGEALVGSASFGIAWHKARIEAEFLGRTHGGDTVLLSTRNDNPALEGKGRHSFDIMDRTDPAKVFSRSPHVRRLIDTLLEKAT